MQALSQAQLRQIATVLQQKHLNSNAADTKNVLFDEQTKTRIVYRYINWIILLFYWDEAQWKQHLILVYQICLKGSVS